MITIYDPQADMREIDRERDLTETAAMQLSLGDETEACGFRQPIPYEPEYFDPDFA